MCSEMYAWLHPVLHPDFGVVGQRRVYFDIIFPKETSNGILQPIVDRLIVNVEVPCRVDILQSWEDSFHLYMYHAIERPVESTIYMLRLLLVDLDCMDSGTGEGV
jgi:hypothetical protein